MSATPVGDSLRAKFGDRVSTHALGTEVGPVGCEGWHSYCAYAAGRAEALREFGAHLDEVARTYEKHPQATEQMARYAKGTLQAAAEMARQRAKEVPS